MYDGVVIGKYTLESLTNGMYTNPLDLFREYIQNSADSIDCLKKQDIVDQTEPQIEIYIDKDKRVIVITDNGVGLPSACAAKTLTDIGNSSKDKRSNRGFRGIGRLSGLGYCESLTFTTSFYGENIKTCVSFDACYLSKLLFETEDIISLEDVLKRSIITFEEPEESEKHYFTVELDGVKQSKNLLDDEVIEDYLVQCAPLPFNETFSWAHEIREKVKKEGYVIPEYKISLNGKQLFKPYQNSFICDRVKKKTDSIKDIKVTTYSNEGGTSAILWNAEIDYSGTILDDQVKGIRIRQGNILIGDKATCRQIFKEGRFNSWMLGEIYITDSSFVVNARRDNFESTIAQRNFYNMLYTWSISEIQHIRHLAYQRSVLSKLEPVDGNRQNSYEKELNDLRNELAYIDNSDIEEVAQVEYADILRKMLDEQSATKYVALNLNEKLSYDNKKFLEKIFDIIDQNCSKKESKKIISIITNKL